MIRDMDGAEIAIGDVVQITPDNRRWGLCLLIVTDFLPDENRVRGYLPSPRLKGQKARKHRYYRAGGGSVVRVGPAPYGRPVRKE